MLLFTLSLFILRVLLGNSVKGVFISPIAYTLTDVESMNGSSANGGCPQECEGMASGVRRCDCRQSTVGKEAITGVLIDGMVPTIDTRMRGTWAAEMYTVETTMSALLIGFLFQSSDMLHEVELYVFYCPAWDIGAATISVYNGVSFPNLVRIGVNADSVGSVTLTRDMQNCEDLTRVSIPLQMAASTSSYFIEFTSPTTPQQLYIAKVRFSDQPITTFPEAGSSSALITTETSSATTTTDTSNNSPFSTTKTANISTVHNSTTTTTIATTAEATTGKSPLTAAVVGALVGVILALLIFLVLGGVFILVCYIRMKNKNTRIMEIQKLQDVVLENNTSEIGFNSIKILNEQVMSHTYDEIQDRDDISNNQYSSISECIQSRKEIAETYSLVHKTEPPALPSKTPELYEYLKLEAKRNSEEYADDIEVEASNNPLHGRARLKSPKDTEEIAPTEGGIYINPDTQDEEDSATKYTVHNEPSMQPSMFFDSHSESDGDSAEVMCSPIYSLTSSISTSSIKQLTEANLKKIKTLGSGQFGKVILAATVDLSPKDLGLSDTDDDKSKSTRVAVKILKRNPSTSIKEAFEKELKFMSRLNHPNVIKTLGACTMTDPPFVVMEYMEKGDLNQYLQEFDAIIPGNIPPNNLEISTGTLINMSAQVASAMKYLAYRNFIHRDLATRNCLVGPDLEIKIADFGMSRNLYESHYYVFKGRAVLPVRWMARECFYGKFSSKSDVWSFGVTMWEMFTLTKDIPYEDMDENEVIYDAAKKTTPRKLLQRPKDCPQKVYDIMLMCWAVDPKERATFDELYAALSALSTTG